ncbi:OstA-like protein [Flavobacteriaceae bacterium]|nr:OstA-like protein [Flavobacteriaceae bacterium]MDB4062973.1 OstA-like protein [Flavobacteriaceae bacterium]MDC0001228.1 OstA-like protein [Flavobacteriaceae bacterium]
MVLRGYVILLVIFSLSLTAQNSKIPKIIQIRQAGGSTQDQEKFPGANILFKTPNKRVKLFHEGALIESDKAYFYSKNNYFRAMGDVIFTQGDSLQMTCNTIEYDGKTKTAIAIGNVDLKKSDMTLKTEKLNLDRVNDKAFYNTKGIVVDSASTLTSQRGTYFMAENKYRFTSDVTILNPKYIVNSEQLDYFTELKQAYLYGNSKIKGENYTIFCERGFYDMQREKGIFKENATLYYDDKIIKGDSLYFESEHDYASASKNVSIVDSLNNSIITGHYAEIFKAKDSAIITRRAMAINIVDQDSLFIHADTLVATGPQEKRILRGYYDVRILKSDIRGRSDSLYLDQSIGLTKLLSRPLTNQQEQIFTEADRNGANPVLWFGESQMSGDKIFLLSDLVTRKLDSLKITGNIFIIEKDTLSVDGYQQIKGGILNGAFKEGRLDNIVITKNTEMVYYLYNDEDLQLIGIDKTTCSALQMNFNDGQIENITFLVSPNGDVYPEEELPLNDRTLKGFIWRITEKPETIEDLFDEKDREDQFPEILGLKFPEEESKNK